jgi:hypothetical protein
MFMTAVELCFDDIGNKRRLTACCTVGDIHVALLDTQEENIHMTSSNHVAAF